MKRTSWGSMLGLVVNACYSAPPPVQPAAQPERRCFSGFKPARDIEQSPAMVVHLDDRKNNDDAARSASAAAPRDVELKVKVIVEEQLDVDEQDVRLDSRFVEDLGADSLGLVELTLAFEEAFEIDIRDEDAERIRTVADAIRFIEAETKPAGSSERHGVR